MNLPNFTGLSVLIFVLAACPAAADQDLPFRGTWEGSTESATFIDDDTVLVVSSGSGKATHLGRFEMTSPHFSHLSTLEADGEQNFSAANGDELFAEFSGQFVPNEDGTLEGLMEATIVGGTGRFHLATGSYQFHVIARPGEFGFDSTATFRGTIQLRGSN